MSKYKWDLNELRLNKALLEYTHTQLSKDINCDDLLELISGYSDMIMLAKKNKDFSSFNDTYQDIDLARLIDYLIYSYNEKNIKYIDLLLQTFLIINDTNFNCDIRNYNLAASNDELVNLCVDFFVKMTTPTLASKFCGVLGNKNIINISYSKNDSDSDYAGVTIFDRFLDKKYVQISRSNRLHDLSTLPHEMFHYLFNDSISGTTSNYNSYYLTEVEGAMANILFSEYFVENAYDDNYFFKDYYKLAYVNQITDLVIRNGLIGSLDDKKKLKLNKLNKYLSYYDIDTFNTKEEIIPYLVMPEEVTIKYALSYLCAIDLYEMYKEDREKAFYHLKNICFNKRCDDIITLLRNNNITFMDDGYKNLDKYLKK